MISRAFLLHHISGFENKKDIIVEDQSTGDIIKAILDTHPKYKNDYNKIAGYFRGSNEIKSCEKIWNFLKKNIRYVVESENKQFVRSPAAILKQAVSDCKCYALFAGGICDSLGMKFCYRFASYNDFSKQPGHVFVVVNPGTQNEIWIDPVLSYFNYKKPYYFKIDKKPKMAIYSISGIGRASKAQRMARRTARRKAGKGFGQKLKKGLRGVLKVAAAPARNAFLGLVQLNVHNLAKKLAVAYAKNPTSLKQFWESFGGRIDKLLGAINRGKKKRRILGVEESSSFDGMPYAIGSVGGLIATAAPILAKVASFLKKIGIDPKDLVDLGKKAINAKAKELLSNQLIPEAEQEQEYEQQAEESIEN
jgi:hypothetical protein